MRDEYKLDQGEKVRGELFVALFNKRQQLEGMCTFEGGKSESRCNKELVFLGLRNKGMGVR